MKNPIKPYHSPLDTIRIQLMERLHGASSFKQIKIMAKWLNGYIVKLFCFVLLFFLFFSLPASHFPLPIYAAGASFSLSPASGSYKVDAAFNVNVVLNTGGEQTSGADAILLYEPQKLGVQTITAGTIFSSYPVKTTNSTAGKISISGIISDATSSFSGEGSFATITFKPLSSGTTTVRFDFTLNEPTDSNVAKKGTQGEDILSSVSNATYTLTGTTVTPTPGSGGPTPPTSGVFEITFAFLLAGLAFFTSGFFLFLKTAL